VYLPLNGKQAHFGLHFAKLSQAGATEQFIIFLEILHLLSRENFQGLEVQANIPIAPQSIERIEKIFDFISAQFHQNITSQQAAELLHLTNASFCRFFQKYTQKTFRQVLNEYRIAHACKLLAHTDKSIETIAYASGYTSHSFFTRMFRRNNGLSPLAYRREWHGTLSR
jgi:YesN/AraC family two-component response regulator